MQRVYLKLSKKIANRASSGIGVINDILPNVKEATEASHKALPAALRQYALMRFLQYPKTAQTFARVSTQLIHSNKFWKPVVEVALTPLVKAFSFGETTEKAVAKALPFLEKNQQILLDYVEEMIVDPRERESVYQELDRLLQSMEKTSLNYFPIKMTALIDPEILIKLSQDKVLTSEESNLYDLEVERVYKLVNLAVKMKKIIFIDQEYPHQKRAIFEIMKECLRKYNKNSPNTYITIQAADKDCFSFIKQICNSTDIAKPAIKLVNGAYVHWAKNNGYKLTVQKSKMHSFIAYVLIAKYCLRRNAYLYAGTHNPILEKIINDIARELNVDKDKYMHGQLYGFETNGKPESMYAIFGRNSACVAYSLRRVVEGSASYTEEVTPTMSISEIREFEHSTGLHESLTEMEIKLLEQAVRFNVQDVRTENALSNVRRFF